MAHATIIGNLGKDPELKTSKDGQSQYATFSVAWRESTRDATGNWIDGPVTWVHVTCFGKYALNAAQTLRKGARVVTGGELRVEEWASQQGPSNVVTLKADYVAADLKFATAQIIANQPANNGGFGQQPQQRPAQQQPAPRGGFAQQPAQQDAWNSQPTNYWNNNDNPEPPF